MVPAVVVGSLLAFVGRGVSRLIMAEDGSALIFSLCRLLEC